MAIGIHAEHRIAGLMYSLLRVLNFVLLNERVHAFSEDELEVGCPISVLAVVQLCCYKVYCNKVLLHGATRCVTRNHFEVFKGVTKVFRGQTGSNTPGRPSNRVKYEFSQGPPL